MLFHKQHKPVIGVVHLLPLPGSPRWSGNLDPVIEHAVVDAKAYEQGGADAVIIENFWDAPFAKTSIDPETLAAMSVAGATVSDAVKIPIGFNVLRNDARSALALCVACGGAFVRVNVHSGAMLTDQGIIEGDAYHTIRLRKQLCPNVTLLADVHVKHAVPLGNCGIAEAARDTLERGGADALIVSGKGTGLAADIQDVERVRRSCPEAQILLGSGVTADNVGEFLQLADGVIVGTSLKRSGKISNPVDLKRVTELVRAVRTSAKA